MEKARSTLAVYSGGLDSTVMLHKLAKDGILKAAITFNYGQKHSKELHFAAFNCQRLGIPLCALDLRSITEVFGNNSLTDAAKEVPDGAYGRSNMQSTVVPNRNMIMLSIATARAISLGCDSVAYAAHSGDHEIYPDCREEFALALGKAMQLCHYTPIGLLRPFVNVSKADIVRLGADIGVDFSKTWSCYKGAALHCGKCGTCVERIQAFAEAGVEDPTEYER